MTASRIESTGGIQAMDAAAHSQRSKQLRSVERSSTALAKFVIRDYPGTLITLDFFKAFQS